MLSSTHPTAAANKSRHLLKKGGGCYKTKGDKIKTEYQNIHLNRFIKNFFTSFKVHRVNMAAQRQSDIERFRGENHTAFVVGYTGETGKEIVKEMARTKAFKKVFLLGRRTIDLGPDVGPEFVSKNVPKF